MHNFEKFFSNIASDLKIPKKVHSVLIIIETFQKHPSILNIKKRNLDSVFSFRKTIQREVSKVFRDLNTKKVC